MNENTDESLSAAVVDAVATRDGTEPTKLEPLYGVIDPEALDDLFRTAPGRVTFEYGGYRVTVTNTADVDVEPLTAP